MSGMLNDDLKMQDFSHAESSYHRPHDPEVVIPAGVVKPFPIKEDGSWDLGQEEPVQTRPSLRRRRTVLAWAVGAFTIGSLLIVLSSPYSNEFLAPGPLHSSHAQLLAGQGANRCASCHTGAANSAFGWVAHAFSGASNKISQSNLCLECHKASFEEGYALNPHNVAPEELAKRTAKFQNASFVSKLTMPPVTESNEIACSACHREHKGSQDLKAMTDAQCQSCHQSNFHSFEKDHPEFTNWPESSLQNIAFDHSTHVSKHFPSANTTFDCNRCHVDDAWQNVKVLAPFQQSCASCHEKSIVDSGTNGFAILSLPMLDMQAIEREQLGVGAWPLSATGDFDGAIPPAMKLLLMADSDAAPILASKPKSFEFMDFDPGNPDDVRDAVTIVWSIKRMLHEFSLRGTSAFKRRLEIVLQRDIEDSEVKGMLGGLDQNSFAAATRRWFPGIGLEINQKFGGLKEFGLLDTVGRRDYLAHVSPEEVLAENPLKQLLGKTSDDSADEIAAGPALQLELKPNSEKPRELTTNPTREQPLVQLEQSNDSQPLLSPESVPSQRPAPLRADPITVVQSAPRARSENPVATAKPDLKDGMQTGWIRDDIALRMYYRPSGHEDKFLKHWIDLVVGCPDAENQPETASLFASLTKPTSIGNCRYCHTMKRNASNSLVMNWEEKRRDGSKGQFTSFSHRPHLVQPVLQDCSHCHQLDETVSNKDSFASVDRMDQKSNFRPIQKATCASFHRE